MKRFLFLIAILAPALAEANTVSDALQQLRPGAEWILDGNSYDGIQWMDQNQIEPSREEVETLVAQFELEKKRKAEYPPVEDRVNALLNGGQSLVDIKKKIDDVNKAYPVPADMTLTTGSVELEPTLGE